MPELHFNAPVQGPAFLRIIGGQRVAGAFAAAGYRFRRQMQGVLHRQSHAPCVGFGQAYLIAVNARVPAAERGVIGVANEAHLHVVLVFEIVQGLCQLIQKLWRDVRQGVVVVQRRYQVFQHRAARMAFFVMQHTDGFHPAHFDAFGLRLHGDLLVHGFLGDLVVPHLDFHATVLGPPLIRIVVGNRLAVTDAFVRDRFGRQIQCLLEILGGGAGALLGKPQIVAIFFLGLAKQLDVVAVTHEMQPHVDAVAHLNQDLAQLGDVLFGNLRLAGGKGDRRNHIGKLFGGDVLLGYLLHFHIALQGLQICTVVLSPGREVKVVVQLGFDVLAQFGRFQNTGAVVATAFNGRGAVYLGLGVGHRRPCHQYKD